MIGRKELKKKMTNQAIESVEEGSKVAMETKAIHFQKHFEGKQTKEKVIRSV